MKKIYCKNCKYYYQSNPDLSISYSSILDICMKLSKIGKDVIGNKVWTKKMDCFSQNHDNYCSFYQRIWYKFWVK
jgi:hypothetical protein